MKMNQSLLSTGRLFMTVLFCVINIIGQSQNIQFSGGQSDGYTSTQLTDGSNVVTLGAGSDGAALLVWLDNGNIISLGSEADGGDQEVYIDQSTLISNGSAGDGYASYTWLDASNIISLGAASDGYEHGSLLRKYWTGNTNTAWLVASNWEDLMIPEIMDEVIIPPDRLFYPLLGGGLLNIGGMRLNDAFRCKTIWVQASATFRGKIGTYLQNKSSLIIDGEMIWINPSANAFQNFPGATVELRSGGLLLFGSN
jgi:hypothetical protein